MTDPISHFIIQLKNGSIAKKEEIVFPYSKYIFAIATLLKEGGWVSDVAKRGKKQVKTIEVKLSYADGEAKISGVKRVSKPSRRTYRPAKSIHSVQNGFGRSVISTTKGLLFGDTARKSSLGGEVLFEIW